MKILLTESSRQTQYTGTFMRNIMVLSALVISLVFSSLGYSSATGEKLEAQKEEQVASYQHSGIKYPPVLFATNIDDVPVKKTLDSYGAFSRIDTEAVGLPIGIRVLKGHRTKQDGTQFSTLMLSASTLGIIPVVSNTEFKVYYDVFVQGKSIKQFKYQVDSTDVGTLWTVPHGDRAVKPSEASFIEYTLPLFMKELSESEEVQSVFEEYREYFGEG